MRVSLCCATTSTQQTSTITSAGTNIATDAATAHTWAPSVGSDNLHQRLCLQW